MTDKDNRRGDVPEDQRTGEEYTRVTGSNTAADSGEGDEESNLSDEGMELAIEQIELNNSNDPVESVSPRPVSKVKPEGDISSPRISLQRSGSPVLKSRTPKSTANLADPMLTPQTVSVSQQKEKASEQPVSTTSQQNRRMNRGRTLGGQEITVTRLLERVGRESRPTTQLTPLAGSQQLLDELEEFDPVFQWGGGLPYSSDRPVCIVHRATEEVPSFEFLQRSLRDAYSESRGGEPTIKHAEFVANELRVPDVPGSIVTIDVSGDEWSPSQTNGRPAIEHAGVDIVPDLVDQVETLYSGGLGYLLINIPQRWEGSVRFSGFTHRLVEHLASVSLPKASEEETGVLERLQAAPVSIATPRVEEDTFDDRIACYYAFNGIPGSWETIAQADTVFQRLLRSGRWTQVALTERQTEGGESDQHYNWKGILTEGMARELWQVMDPETPFNTFVRATLLEENPLESEHDFGESGPVADIYFDATRSDAEDALTAFLLSEDDESIETGLPAVIEFETGFSEGAFQYRKLSEALEKYHDYTSSIDAIYIVIPPRILYRGREQALLVQDLVKAEATQFDDLTVELCVPVLENGRCIGIRRVEPLIDTFYDND
ncbi:hypothetical protein EXE51_08380 [Halorubrum sp. CGM5_25_10-8B]|uniref:hypothetical protein n=1 Tax=Halorubrum sp. CGM5_25_10-8B TaxID=2518115 RepID=UPI0010F7C039|nr:hypothetical protein [Halorubrum sp. CGM5_25_10-8B]TKX37076.1 hypothetical protein EXE51_08380 [Halorubrum sp. CGM5_25_10-8B]